MSAKMDRDPKDGQALRDHALRLLAAGAALVAAGLMLLGALT